MEKEYVPYWQKLKDPRWQRKRLEIMERDNFECQNCGDKDTTLNVHHGYYEKGVDPWEYPDNSLVTLCEPCHLAARDRKLALDKMIAHLRDDDGQLLGYATALRNDNVDMQEDDVEVLSYGFAEGFGNFFQLSAEDVIEKLTRKTMTTVGAARKLRASRQKAVAK